MDEIQNGNLNNIDALLAETMNEPVPSFLDTDKLDSQYEEPMKDVAHTEPAKEITEEAPKEEKPAAEVDEYGMEVPKQEKVYTESEVQAMIRDRLSRGKQTIPEPPPVYQQDPIPQPTLDPANGESWEAQLESFIEGTLSKREKQAQDRQWQAQQQEVQAQFEVKFNAGAAKYPDFEAVVHGKTLTPQMVIATRGMNDPAAFIYAAAKTQAPELERIAKIGDPYGQAVELGKLEERMRKARSNTSSAPKPIEAIKGDVTEKVERTRNIDDKIRDDEMRLRKERARR